MSITIRPAIRQDVSLLILLAGGTGSGKTESAMRLATGLAGGERFVVLDTENGRALHKADDYAFDHAALEPPFTPENYAEAVRDVDAKGYPVIVIDSGSHEYEGIGGLLDLRDEEFTRLGDRKDAAISSWNVPKQRHKRFVRELLRVRAHVILCLRAEDKIEVVKVDGKTVVRPRESLTGAEGWVPICEKRLPFEATISLLLTADQPGVPKPIKLEERHRPFIALDRPIDEETGKLLAAWARGTKTGGGREEKPLSSSVREPSAAESSFRVPDGVPEPLSLTPAEFKRKREEAGISQDEVKAKRDELFPGIALSNLKPEQWGQMWMALYEKQEALV